MLFVAGTAQAGLNVLFVTGLQQNVPSEGLGKRMSIVLPAAYGGYPIAIYGAGHLVESVGPAWICRVGAAVMCIGFATEFRSV